MLISPAKQVKHESVLDYTMESTDYTNFKKSSNNKFKSSGLGSTKHS
jgi:hypothetical protein